MTSANPAAGQSPTEAPELAPGTLVEGRYRVVRLIGVGGTGVVYEVEHTLTSQRLALKTLLDRAQAPRLEQEGRALARLRSPHVVKVVDLGSGASEVGPFLVMTLLVGRNLRDVLEGRQKLSLSFVANVAVQVCEGLEEAHRAGLVHRDLKPDNIHLADPAPTAAPRDPKSPHELAHATVFDFGVVKVAATEQTSQLTRTGSTVGTPYYMSLEQLRGSGTVDALSDVYALCVVLYECLAGARPFEAGTLGDLIYAICSTTPVHLSTLRPDLPKPVVDTVMNGLSRVKEERPRSMRDLAIALEPYADKGFTVWLRLPEQPGAATPQPGAAAAPPPAAPLPAAPPPAAPPAAGPINVPKATLGTDTATGPGTATTPRPRFPRPTQQLQRPPPKKPDAPGGPSAPPPPNRPSPPGPPKAPGATAGPDPALLQSQDIVSDPTTSSLDGTTPVEDEPVRDRETPTEMYVREVHGEVAADPPAQVPTMSLPATPSPTFGSPFANPDPSTLDSGDKTAVLEFDAVQAQARAAAPSFGAGPASVPQISGGPAQQAAPPSFGQPPTRTALGTSSPPNGIPAPAFPPMQPRPQMHSGSFSAAELGMAPSWKTRVDEALSSLGKRGNDLGVKTLARFRTASQEQQIVIVVVVTATVAVLLVGFVYLLVV